MKLWEIIREAQENGAKIRDKQWDSGAYIVWGGKAWKDENGDDFSLVDLNSLELYKEHIRTFGPDRAMYWLERGKLVKREAWVSGEYSVLIRDRENVRWKRSNYIIPLTDWFHNDWHLCDGHGNYIPEPEESK